MRHGGEHSNDGWMSMVEYKPSLLVSSENMVFSTALTFANTLHYKFSINL